MKIITTHSNPDFDGFACCVGLKKLFPEYEIVISGKPAQNLDEFLKLYEDKFLYVREQDLPPKFVIEELVIADTPGTERISEFLKNNISDETNLIIIDHHPSIRDTNETANIRQKIIKETGAASTIVVNLLRERNIPLYKEEATLLAIAVYEDTGSLTFSSTTMDDFYAVMYLLENGANLTTVSDYIRFDLTIDQKTILEELIRNVQLYELAGHKLAISYAESEKFIGGLNAIAAKFWYTYNTETLIVIVRMGKKVYLVGRTKSHEVNLAEMMKTFNGGGHRQAASGSISNASIDEIIHKILQIFPDYVEPVLRAKDIMSKPVRTVFVSDTIDHVNKLMETTGHSSFPIVDENKVVGIVTKKAVDKALNHHLGKRPVKSIMTSRLITAKETDPVKKIKELMIKNGIGRVPIFDENNILVGIITRSDIIRAENYPNAITIRIEESLNFSDVKDIMRERIPRRLLNLLRLLGNYGEDLKIPVYVVGGFVRDLLLGIENFDIDIVVEGNGTKFADYVAESLNVTVVKYEKFLTASLIFKDGLKVDVATARTEYYEQPGELPLVDFSTIKKDLYRRDFTINAMAIKLNPQEFGRLYDFFNCRNDLENGIIRILHSLSFVDDPTRMIRAVRFEQRYGFSIEENTFNILKRNLEDGFLERITGPRIRQEIEKILEEVDPLPAIRRLAEIGILRHIFPKTYYTPTMEEKIKRMLKFLPYLKEKFQNISDFYALSTILLEYYDTKTLDEMRQKYGYPKKFIDSLKASENTIVVVKNMIENEYSFSEIYKILGKANPYTYCQLSSYLNEKEIEYLKKYIERILTTKLEKVSGTYLMERYSLKAGPELNKILENIYSEKLDREIDEFEILEKVLAEVKEDRD